MKGKQNIPLVIAVVLLLLLGCSIWERGNPLDPGGVSYQPPTATIDFPYDGYVSGNSQIGFQWHGNNPNCSYSYKLTYADTFDYYPESGWSAWENAHEVTIGSLDEETYTFGVKARYPSGEEQNFPPTVSFLVDAYPDSSLLIKPCSTSVSLYQEFTIHITIKEIENLMAAKINLNFSKDTIEIVPNGIQEGALLRQNGGEVVLFDSVLNSQGSVEIDLGIAEGTSPGVSGSGSLVMITFKAKMMGIASISFEFYELRDTNNLTIHINDSRGSKVTIE